MKKSEAGLTQTSLLKCSSELVAMACAAVFTTSATVTTRRPATRTTAFFTRPGDIHRQGTALNVMAVERADSRLGLFRGAHGDESEAAWTPALAIRHQLGFEDSAMHAKGGVKIAFGGVERKIPDE